MALDRLETAEALLRRSIAADASAHTRRRLADVLAAQNAMAEAVNEYKRVIDAAEDSVRRSWETRGANRHVSCHLGQLRFVHMDVNLPILFCRLWCCTGGCQSGCGPV